MSDIQKIKLKRTKKNLSEVIENNVTLDFGEPLYLKDGYLVIGSEDSTNISNDSKAIKAQTKDIVDNSVFHKTTEGFSSNASSVQLTNDTKADIYPKTSAENVSYTVGENNVSNLNDIISGILNGDTTVPNATNATYAVNTEKLKTTNARDGNYYILGVTETINDTNKSVYHAGAINASQNQSGIYFDGTGVIFGAAWNDFAEFRKCEINTPGICVIESEESILKASRKYRESTCAYIISDTFGMVIGEKEEDTVPVAVAGRVLAHVEKREKLRIGDALKTAPGGKLARMNRIEKILYPDKIIGYVSEIPSYEKWNSINVNNRVWVKI